MEMLVSSIYHFWCLAIPTPMPLAFYCFWLLETPEETETKNAQTGRDIAIFLQVLKFQEFLKKKRCAVIWSFLGFGGIVFFQTFPILQQKRILKLSVIGHQWVTYIFLEYLTFLRGAKMGFELFVCVCVCVCVCLCLQIKVKNQNKTDEMS